MGIIGLNNHPGLQIHVKAHCKVVGYQSLSHNCKFHVATGLKTMHALNSKDKAPVTRMVKQPFFLYPVLIAVFPVCFVVVDLMFF